MKTLIIFGVVFASPLLAGDPSVGSWALNVEKSTLESPERARGTVMTIEFIEGTSYRYKFTFPNRRSSEEARNYQRSPSNEKQ